MGVFSRIFAPRKAKRDAEIQEMANLQAMQTRNMMAEIKRLQHEARVLEQQREIKRLELELEELSNPDDDEEDSDDSSNALLAMLLNKVLSPGSASGGASPFLPTNAVIPSQSQEGLTDAEIRTILSSIPKKYLKIAKGMDDATLKGFIKQRGNYSDDTVNRTLNMVRNI